MRKKIKFTLLGFLIFPEFASANTGAPFFAALGGASIFYLPIIILIEWIYFKLTKVHRPFKLALIVNLMSAAVGGILAVIGLTILKWPFIESPTAWKIWFPQYPGRDWSSHFVTIFSAQFIMLIFFYFSSSLIEAYTAKKMNPWKNLNLPRKLFFKSNGFTYALTLCFLIYNWYRSWQIIDELMRSPK